jgi:flagellin-like protein
MVSVVYDDLCMWQGHYRVYGRHAYDPPPARRDVRRRPASHRGLAEIVGTLMLVLIVVAAAVAFSLFVASYEKQVLAEENATHLQKLEAVRIVDITPTTGWTELSLTIASGDVNYMNLTDYDLNGQPISYWTLPYTLPFTINGTPTVITLSCEFPGNQSCDMVAPFGQVTVMLVPQVPLTPSADIKLNVFTALANDFTFTFIPPTAIAKVSYVQTGPGVTTPVFDGSGSFQTAEADNASLVSWDWTLTATNGTVVGIYSGEEVEVGYLTSGLNTSILEGTPFHVTLTVTNSDGLLDSVTIPYQEP